MEQRALAVVVLVVCVALVPSSGATVAEGSRGSVTETSDVTRDIGGAAAGGTINLTNRLALTPNEAGEIEVTTEVTLPDPVVNATVYLPAEATVTATDGFQRVNATTYRTDEASASVTYDLPANRTRQRTGPEGEGSGGDFVFADAGDWAVVRRPAVGLSWFTRESVSAERSLAVEGEGVAGTSMAFLGDHRTVSRTAHGQRFDLVIPAAASMAASPTAVLDSLANASGDLQVGDRDERVLAIAAPTSVSWGVAGLQTGDTDFWVAANESLDDANNVWLHEYVHTRQDYTTSTATRWTVEGGADYYAALLALEQGHIDFESFRSKLERGRADGVRSSVLSEPSNWTGYANYYKGALVMGDLDRRTRLAGDRAFESVWRSMNAHDGPVSQADFLGFVADAANESVRDGADRFTTSEDAPAVWSRRAHLTAFGSDDGVSYRFRDTLLVNGTYRNGTLNRSSVRVVPGERLTATAVAENVNASERPYNLSVWLDATRLDSTSGRLAAGKTATLSAATTLDTTGEYALTTGDDTVAVSVESPAAVSVAAVSLNRTTLRGSGVVGVTVAVRNGASIPANDTLALAVDGRIVTNRTVELAPGTVARVTVPVRVDGVGTHTVGVDGGPTENVTVEERETTTVATATTTAGATTGTTATTAGTATTERTANFTVTVVVGTETTTSGTDDAGSPTGGSGPGFGPGVALAALAVLSALWRLQRVE